MVYLQLKLSFLKESCRVVWFGFNGISTIVGFLIQNPVYTYILNINDFVICL